jgi:hypothetical protein
VALFGRTALSQDYQLISCESIKADKETDDFIIVPKEFLPWERIVIRGNLSLSTHFAFYGYSEGKIYKQIEFSSFIKKS